MPHAVQGHTGRKPTADSRQCGHETSGTGLIFPHGEWGKQAMWVGYSMVVSIQYIIYGYGSIPIHTIFRGMNIHLPAIIYIYILYVLLKFGGGQLELRIECPNHMVK